MDPMRDLAVLADLPELVGHEETPTSEIALMPLGRWRHPKFGDWKVTRETFDSFLANFASQGRVPVDYDHSPERGKGTEAAGWITDLKVVGDTLRATVQWTKKGAAAVRDRAYMYISPTWSFNARDPKGKELGPRLLGAGLTNRPFFSNLPTLNLAAVDQRGEPYIVMDEHAQFAEHWQLAQAHGIDEASRDEYELFWRHQPAHLHASMDGELKIIEAGRACQKKWWRPIRMVLNRDPTRPGTVTGDDPTAPVVFSAPPDLDAEGERLHGDVVAYAAEHALDDYGAALAGLSGLQLPPPARYPDQPPERQYEIPAGVPDEEAAAVAELERRARAFARREQIDWVDAGAIVELNDRIAEAEAEEGSSSTPWLDTSNPVLARPWSEEDFERDARRARTLEWGLTKDEWLAGAEAGRDLVYDEAVKRRADAIAELRYERDRDLAEAKEREQRRRKQALEDELERRARRRLSQ